VKRAPIVIAGTVAGLVAVLEFHTTPVKLTLTGGASLPSAAPGSAGATTQPASGGSTPAKAARPSATASSTAAPARTSATTRTATGSRVNYSFGVLSVKITVSGSKITKVGIAYLYDSDSPRSQMIDEQAIPILEQQALQAQSASIQGVSGASFTSKGFEQSLQSALHSLDI
jgi:uncharacterized protein with FMN-binding domain